MSNFVYPHCSNVGSTVTINGIMDFAKTSAKTVARYLDILEQMFVVRRLYGFSNNLQTEIKKGFKIYFIDIGLRNSILENFNKDYPNSETFVVNNQNFENFL